MTKTKAKPAAKKVKKGAAKTGPAVKRKTGRPSGNTPAVAEAICERLAEGESLRSICRDDAMPGVRTVFGWLENDPAFRTKYVRAREIQADLEAECLTAMADEEPPRLQSGAVDTGWVQWQKMRIGTRQWTAAKLLPKKYGEKIELEHGGAVRIETIERVIVDPATK